MMKSPFWTAVVVSLLGLLLATLLVLWPMLGPRPVPSPEAAGHGAPWNVDLAEPGRSRVFGLSLPGSTLGQAHQRWGGDIKLALMASPGRDLVVEGYVERFEAGGVTGRLLLRFDDASEAPALARWRAELAGSPTESGAYQHVLTPPALADLAGLGLVGLTFIPVAQLDAQVLQARFGEPAERRVDGERLTHWLYPALGLAVALDSGGRDLLQYVAPAEFQGRLVAPLPAASAAPP